MTLDNLTAKQINDLVDVLILTQRTDKYIISKSNEENDWIGLDMIDVSFHSGKTVGRGAYFTYTVDEHESVIRLFI